MDETRLLVAAPRHAEVEAHPQLLALLGSEDLGVETRLLGPILGDLGHLLGSHLRGWLIDEVARAAHRLGDELAAIDGSTETIDSPAVLLDGEGRLEQRIALALLREVALES